MQKIDIITCPKEKNKKIKEYQKNYHEAKKSQFSDKYNSFLIT